MHSLQLISFLPPDSCFLCVLETRIPTPLARSARPCAQVDILIEQSDMVIISLHVTRREQAHDLIADIETKRQGQGVVITEAVEQAVHVPEVLRRLQALLK